MTGEERTVTLELRSTPPSMNRYGRSKPAAQGRMKGELQEDLGRLLLVSGLPRQLQEVRATAVLRFPSRRDRDEGNFRWLLEKALGDALVAGGWLEKDTASRFRFGELSFDEERGAPATTITLRCR